METKIGLQKKDLTASVEVLNQLLANQTVLYVKTRNFHWNVSGSSYMELHKLLENQYDVLAEAIDQVAERVTQLDATPLGTMKQYLEIATLKEAPAKKLKSEEMLTHLLEDHRQLCVEIRTAITETLKDTEDEVTIDFLTGQLAQHEELVWILRKYVG